MILPPTGTTADATTTNLLSHVSDAVTTSSAPGGGGGGGISYPENWNSIIGIVTAIVGNIMISFALNMQRYAHIRLEREWQEKERRRKQMYRSRGYGGGESAGTKKRNGMRERSREGNGEAGRVAESTEHDPLLASAGLRRSSTRATSRPSLNPIGEEEEGVPEAAYKPQSYLKSPYWWAGIILMTTGEAGNFLAYGFAPASIVSPLGVVALISNCIIAPILLKEPYRKRDGLGVLIAVGGAVTVVLSASDNNPKLGPDEIWDLICRWEFETYLGITVGVITVLMVASNRFGEKNILVDLGLVGLFGRFVSYERGDTWYANTE
jgi:drug/metabolite transporter (DMT)-like permease